MNFLKLPTRNAKGQRAQIPHAAFPVPPAPRGVTLTEVLISMGILAIGLLGAAAMFPVGGYFMQKGEIADRGAAIAQAAFADLVARGDLSPENWRMWDPNWNSGSGAYRPMGDYMRGWMENQNRSPEHMFQTSMNGDTGFVYVIDPLGTAGALRAGTVNARQMSYAPIWQPETALDVQGSPNELKWNGFTQDWPVRRLCTNSMLMGNAPSEAVASRIYSSGDDISFSVDDAEVPTRQRVVGPDANNDGIPEAALARESQGDYSWMAMIAPTTSDAREALALDPSAYYYDVSVVVFFKRPISNIDTTERLVRGHIVSTGTGGGEILLTSDGGVDPYEELREGQWVMVSGPHPNSTPDEPLFFSQWYRVLVIDDEPDNLPLGSTTIGFRDADTQRRIGLRGPDWPWTTTGSEVRVGLFPGAVAVHTKTMRLESYGSYTQ